MSRYHRPKPTPLSNRRTKPSSSSSSLLNSLSSTATTAATASTILLTAQAAHVGWSTPRLPPPPNSGYNFPLGGLVTVYNNGNVMLDADEEDGEVWMVEKERMLHVTNNNDDGSSEEEEEEDNHQEEKKTEASPKHNHKHHHKGKEFNLVLLGDSPIEGIGNKTHSTSLSGQTAKAFSKLLCSSGSVGGNGDTNQHDKVRYWSFGLSGLTAKGIQEHMVPMLHRLNETSTPKKKRRRRKKKRVDAVVLSAGVNNVLWGQSASSFAWELKSLIKAIRAVPGCEDAVILVLGLPDFARMPFLPWPLCSVVGWRGRALSGVMERVVREVKEEEEESGGGGGGRGRIVLAKVPEVEDVFGDIQRDKCLTNRKEEEHDMERKPVHVLLDHLKDDPEVLSSLEMKDFFADDGFHPGKHGTILLGNLLAGVYAKEMGISIRLE